MPSKNVTLNVDQNLYEEYKAFCKIRGWIISRQFEIMMEEHLKNHRSDKMEP